MDGLLDRQKIIEYGKMEVRDCGDDKWRERYVICFNADGSCITVNNGHETDFEEEGSFGIIRWEQYRPITQPPVTTISMIVAKIANAPKGFMMREQWDVYIAYNPYITTEDDPKDFSHTIVPEGYTGDLEDLEWSNDWT